MIYNIFFRFQHFLLLTYYLNTEAFKFGYYKQAGKEKQIKNMHTLSFARVRWAVLGAEHCHLDRT